MKKLRWQLLIVVLALAAIAVLLLGRQPVIQSVQPAPVEGGIYTEGLVGSMGRLNPLMDYFNQADRDINRLLYSGLIRFDSRGIPQPDLAESWGISQDGTVYNFSLRPNVIWHDGTPVTTTDIVYTVELLRDPESPLTDDLREFWDQIEVKLLDDKTIQFILPEPFSPFLDYLDFGVLPEHLVGHLSPADLMGDDFNLHPVGSGPYSFDRFLTEDGEVVGVVLDAFIDYYVQRPFIDQFVFRYYPDAAHALSAYQEGEIQGIGTVSNTILDSVLKEPGLNLYSGRTAELRMIFLNLDNEEVPFFQIPEVRRALLMGLNRRWMIDRILNGQAILAHGPVLPGTWAYYDGIEPVPFDDQGAIKLLIDAGYSLPASGGAIRQNEDGPLAFELLYPDDEISTQIAEAIQRDWEKIGVQADLTPVPIDRMEETYLSAGEYQAALINLDQTQSTDPDPYSMWHQAQITNGQNYARWNDRPASEYLEQARVILNLEDRARLYRNFQVRFSRELPALPLLLSVYNYAVAEEVQGIRLGPVSEPSERFQNVYNWFLITRRAVAQDTITPTPPTER